jgi:hypothetical protein
MVMLELPVPPGFVPEGFDPLVADGRIARYQIRPRSVLVYLRGLEPNLPLTLPYRLTARLAIQAEAPGGRVYEYYNPARGMTTAGTRFTVQDSR